MNPIDHPHGGGEGKTSGGKSDVMVYDRSRSRATLLTANLRGSVRNPTISGDGRQIAFETNQDGQWNIAIVNGQF